MFSGAWWCDVVMGFRKRWAIRARERLFHEILDRMSSPIDKVADMFGQAPFYRRVDLKSVVSEPEYGTLYIPVKAEFEGVVCDHAWSIYQTGRRLRIAVILTDGLEKAPLVDWTREMTALWPETEMHQMDRTGLTLYEWSFYSDRVYRDYVAQETFALNMRHSHIRMLRILYDYAMLQKENGA